MFELIVCGDSRLEVPRLVDDSIDCVVCSPPYFNLRDYGVVGQIGLEVSPLEYVFELASVFDLVRPKLKDSGSVWVNLGDTFFGPMNHTVVRDPLYRPEQVGINLRKKWMKSGWMKPKQLCLIPSRFAIEMQERGWWLRNDVVWVKSVTREDGSSFGNTMPFSGRDRLNTNYEHLFHFTKKAKYFYDLDAIRVPHAASTHDCYKGGWMGNEMRGYISGPQNHMRSFMGDVGAKQKALARGKNPGDVWQINTRPYPDAHFAVFPEGLIERPIKATCPKEVCKKCGKPRERIVENKTTTNEKELKRKLKKEILSGGDGRTRAGLDSRTREQKIYKGETVGWSDCGCGKGFKPGVVLDPFGGAGTTGIVARRLGRGFVLIDLNPDYVKLMKKRLFQHERLLSTY